MSLKFKVKGVHCKSCKMLIEDVLEDEGIQIKEFEVDLQENVATFIANIADAKKVIEAIQSEGEYSVEVIQ